MPLIKMNLLGVDVDLVLCAKKAYANDLTDCCDTMSKKSFNSIQGYQCTKTLETIAKGFLIPEQAPNGNSGLFIFRWVTKLLKYFAKCKKIYGANLCYLNGMTI